MLPAIAEANPNSPRKIFAAMRNERFGDSDPDGGWPAGIRDLGEGRIAAMDAAGIDVQILSNVPDAGAVEVPVAEPGSLPGIGDAAFGIGGGLGFAWAGTVVGEGTGASYHSVLWICVAIGMAALATSLILKPRVPTTSGPSH